MANWRWKLTNGEGHSWWDLIIRKYGLSECVWEAMVQHYGKQFEESGNWLKETLHLALEIGRKSNFGMIPGVMRSLFWRNTTYFSTLHNINAYIANNWRANGEEHDGACILLETYMIGKRDRPMNWSWGYQIFQWVLQK